MLASMINLTPENQQRLTAAQERVRNSEAGYAPFVTTKPLQQGVHIPTFSAKKMQEAQDELTAAQEDLARLRHKLLGE